MGKLILVRHGESEGNRDRRFTTTPASPLTDLGRQQAKDAAARIRSMFAPELVVASPYARARETGEIIARELKLPIRIQEGLHEQSFGQLAGESYDVLVGRFGAQDVRSPSWRPPGGESRQEVRDRVAPILDRLADSHPASDVIVVSHGGVMTALWAHVTGSWNDVRVPPNAGVVVIEHRQGCYEAPRAIDWADIDSVLG